jgi:iron complex outermembrane receptor protein
MLNRSCYLVSASLLALACLSPATADAAGEGTHRAAGPDAAVNTIEDVVVTARRRDEALQEVPIAITALSGDDLVRRGVDSVDNLRNVTPGLNIGGLKRDDVFFFLRGQGPGPVGTARSFPGVATYFAEVPTQLAGSGTLYDLKSVQVLKGPQGTLFGRNTTGGAVLFEPQRPTSESEATAKVSVGNHNFYEFEGMLNAPLKPDQIELRIAGQISRRQGFTQSIITGQHLDDRNFETIRVSLLLKPTERLESLTIADYRGQDGSGASQVLYAVNPAAALGAPINTPGALAPLFGLPAGASVGIPLRAGGTVNVACLQVALPGCPTGPFGGAVAAFQAAYAGGRFADPAAGGFYVVAPTADFLKYLAVQQAIGPRKNQVPDLTRKKRLNIGFTNTTVFQVTDDITLKNILGFRRSRLNESLDYDGTPLVSLRELYPDNTGWKTGFDQVTDEFQVQGNLNALNLKYIGGYYYEDTKPGFAQFSPGNTLGAVQYSYPDFHDKSNAVFGHLEWNPSELFGLSGGLRKTWDQRMQALGQTTAAGVCTLIDPATGRPTCPLSYRAKFSALTYDITASLTPMRGVLLYATHRKGYRSGGFNLPAPVAPAPDPNRYQTFGPETLYTYEVGLKADWNIGMPVRTNLSVFYDDYRNIQSGIGALTAQGQPVQIILSAGKAKNQGVEFETTVVPTDRLRLTGFVSYLDAHATQSLFGPDGSPAVVAGRQRSNSPKVKYGLSGLFSLPLPEAYGEVSLSADWSWQSKVRQPNIVTTVPFYPSYGVLNARIEWKDALRKGLDLSVFANNLLDKEYIQGGYPLGNLGSEAAVYGEPRMYGVSAKIRFGS